MPNPFLVNAAELLRRPGNDKTLSLRVPVVDLDIVDDPRFAHGAAVEVDLRLEALSDGIVVAGRLLVPWQGVCRRCLVDTGGVAISDVHELYQRTVTDPDAFEIIGEQLDLLPAVRELVLLDAPATPLCRPECAGLCPTCGANLNHGPCECAAAPVDPRWSALDQLKGLVDPAAEAGG